eukprot:1635140-Pyramimonas_sp.AAC.1
MRPSLFEAGDAKTNIAHPPRPSSITYPSSSSPPSFKQTLVLSAFHSPNWMLQYAPRDLRSSRRRPPGNQASGREVKHVLDSRLPHLLIHAFHKGAVAVGHLDVRSIRAS